jgi:hypothetical protein
MGITHSQCVFVALRIPTKLACAILPSVARPDLQYFSTLSHKRHDFRKEKKVTEHETCFDFLYKSVWKKKLFIVRGNEREVILNVHSS